MRAMIVGLEISVQEGVTLIFIVADMVDAVE